MVSLKSLTDRNHLGNERIDTSVDITEGGCEGADWTRQN
jgi:hypothetical protein